MVPVAIGLALASSLPFGISDVWDQSVRYQLDSRREATVSANVRKLTTTLWDRLPLVPVTLTAKVSVGVPKVVMKVSVAVPVPPEGRRVGHRPMS